MPEEAKKVKISRPGFDDEGYRICSHCGELEFNHYEKNEVTHKCPAEPHHHPDLDNPYTWVAGPNEAGVVCKLTGQVSHRAKVDAWGSLFRKPCPQQVEHRIQRYYSSKLRACTLPAPETSKLTGLIKFEPPKVSLLSAVIYATPDLFQSEMKTYLRCLLASNPKLRFSYVDCLTVTRIRNIRFDRDGEYKTLAELNEHPLLIFDMDVSSYGSEKGDAMDDADILELLAMRGKRATWFVLSVKDNLNNIPQGVRENIKLLVENPVNLRGAAAFVDNSEKLATERSQAKKGIKFDPAAGHEPIVNRQKVEEVEDEPAAEAERVIYVVCDDCEKETKFDTVAYIRKRYKKSLTDYAKRFNGEDDAVVTEQEKYISSTKCDCGGSLSKIEGK